MGRRPRGVVSLAELFISRELGRLAAVVGIRHDDVARATSPHESRNHAMGQPLGPQVENIGMREVEWPAVHVDEREQHLVADAGAVQFDEVAGREVSGVGGPGRNQGNRQ